MTCPLSILLKLIRILARFGVWHWGKAKNLQSEKAIQRACHTSSYVYKQTLTRHLQIQHLLQHTVHFAPIIQAHRTRLISQQASPERARMLRSLVKHLRAIGRWWRTMIMLDAKGYCNLDQAVQGVGWWWGEVGGVVAGSDGAVINDGTPRRISVR